MDDLVAWLRACLDDDEALAKAANPAPWRRITDKAHLDPNTIFGGSYPGDREKLRNVCSVEVSWERNANAEHIARWDPARVLAEVEAKRTRIAMLVDTMSLVSSPVINEEYRKVLAGVMQSVTWHLLRLDAQPYSARPGFKDEWRLA